MRKILTLAMLLLGLSIAFTSCEKQPEPEPEPTPVSVTGITLDSSSLTLTEGESATLIATISPSNADNQGVIWSSSDASVASVSNGTVTAVSAGYATITAKSDDGGKTATCDVTVKKVVVPEGAVDLGLSVFWATCNLGASSPEEYGDYYAWGETETKTEYSLENYKFYKSETVSEGDFDIEYKGYTKYVRESDADQNGFRGFYDNKDVLDPEDDVAHVKLGGGWRMPNAGDISDLLYNCEYERVTYKGVQGIKFTSKIPGYTDKWIFLPGTSTGFKGIYWSSFLALYSESRYAQFLYFTETNVSLSTSYLGSRSASNTVRPVCE